MSDKSIGRTLHLVVLLFSIGLLSAGHVTAGEWRGNVRLSIGEKDLDKEDWAPFAEHQTGGVEVTWGKKDWPFLIATDLFFSDDEQTEIDPMNPFERVTVMDATGETFEIGVGIRKMWGKKLHPYLGGGLVIISAELSGERVGLASDVSDEDEGTGFWLDGGLFWRIGPHWGVGLGARYSKAEVTLFGNDLEAGGRHISVSWGLNWPANT